MILFRAAGAARCPAGVPVVSSVAEARPHEMIPNMFSCIGGWGVSPFVTPTGKSISVSVRVVRDVRACGRGEAAWEREAAISLCS